MDMLKPKPDEDKNQYTARFMVDDEMKERYPDHNIRFEAAVEHWAKFTRHRDGEV